MLKTSPSSHLHRFERSPRSTKGLFVTDTKKRVQLSDVSREARDLVWAHRGRLTLGLLLMLINRLSGLVLPATSKYLIDDVIGKGRLDLLNVLAFAAGG